MARTSGIGSDEAGRQMRDLAERIVNTDLMGTFIGRIGADFDEQYELEQQLIKIIANGQWDLLSSFIRRPFEYRQLELQPDGQWIAYNKRPSLDDIRNVENILKQALPDYQRYLHLKVWSKAKFETERRFGRRVRFPEGTPRLPSSSAPLDLTGDDDDDTRFSGDNPVVSAWRMVSAVSRAKRRSVRERFDLDEDEPSAMGRMDRKRGRDDDDDEMMA